MIIDTLLTCDVWTYARVKARHVRPRFGSVGTRHHPFRRTLTMLVMVLLTAPSTTQASNLQDLQSKHTQKSHLIWVILYASFNWNNVWSHDSLVEWSCQIIQFITNYTHKKENKKPPKNWRYMTYTSQNHKYSLYAWTNLTWLPSATTKIATIEQVFRRPITISTNSFKSKIQMS